MTRKLLANSAIGKYIALAQPVTSELVRDTDANSVAMFGILRQWRGLPENHRLHPWAIDSKKLAPHQVKCGAKKTLELYARCILHYPKKQLALYAEVQPAGGHQLLR